MRDHRPRAARRRRAEHQREFERSSHTYFWSVYIAFVVVWIGLRTALDIERGVSVESAFLQRWKDYAMIALYCVVIVARAWSLRPPL